VLLLLLREKLEGLDYGEDDDRSALFSAIVGSSAA
jgi:hypothetical protein